MNFVQFTDYIPKEVAVNHSVDGTVENLRNDVATISIRTLKRAQVGKETKPLFPVRAHCILLVDECDQLWSRHTNSIPRRSPITPTVRRLDCRTEPLASELRFLCSEVFHVIKELQKHDPGEHGQAVKVAA